MMDARQTFVNIKSIIINDIIPKDTNSIFTLELQYLLERLDDILFDIHNLENIKLFYIDVSMVKSKYGDVIKLKFERILETVKDIIYV